MALDAITLEVMRNSLLSICEEMAGALVRSSYSPNIKERRDCSCSLYTPAGEMAVQAEHIPVHLGVMPYALQGILQQFPANGMRAGDAYIVNDPYFGGNHLPDLIVAGPLFSERRLVGFAASMAHHNDVGGVAPRSMPATSTEIFQEGLRLPPIQIAKDGRNLDDIVRLIAVNSRTPGERVADLRAQIATIRLAQRRIEEIGHHHGTDNLIAAMAQILDASELAVRTYLESLPDGEWFGESPADFGGKLLLIRVRIRKHLSDLEVDFEDSSAQCHGPFNSPLANTYAAVFLALRVLVGGDIPLNGGMYRPLRMLVPEGTLVNPRYPSAVSAATQVSYHTVEALMRGLAGLGPQMVLADSGGGGVYSFGGVDPRTGDLYAYGEALGGGSGASALDDGESAVMPPISQLRDTPVESLEMSLPVRIERYELIDGSGGAGRFRGGLGFRRVFRMLAPATWSFQISMGHKPPYGLAGGDPGRKTYCRIETAAHQLMQVTAFMTYEADANDVIVVETAGGGGYGSSEERTAEQVSQDLEGGYVRTDIAEEAVQAASGAAGSTVHG